MLSSDECSLEHKILTAENALSASTNCWDGHQAITRVTSAK